MTVGEKISERRESLGMTQQELAEQVFVSEEVIRAWESDQFLPEGNCYARIADALQISVKELFETESKPSWTVKDRMFSESRMFTRLKTLAQVEHLDQTWKALSYAQNMHKGGVRKANKFNPEIEIPYIIHPLMMACHAHALGIRSDEVLTVILLHDVCEDCDVKAFELPFSESVQHSVALLTKYEGQTTEEYYEGIANDSTAAIVKALDRCNNISTMASAFSRKKMIEYVDETEKYVYPLLQKIKDDYMDYSDAIYVIKYQILSVIETVKAMIMQAKA
ncbi:GTP pyrophosphokinase [Lachnospiraceae bacterium]|nr:GTP pyrophosphokinase [Lachnospiraceae bacterium]